MPGNVHRAALCVRWSACGRKFAIGSGDKTVCVCYYESENKWWASKLIRKKHQSSVTSVAWHPSGALLATASTDMHCRVFNASTAGQPCGPIHVILARPRLGLVYAGLDVV